MHCVSWVTIVTKRHCLLFRECPSSAQTRAFVQPVAFYIPQISHFANIFPSSFFSFFFYFDSILCISPLSDGSQTDRTEAGMLQREQVQQAAPLQPRRGRREEKRGLTCDPPARVPQSSSEGWVQHCGSGSGPDPAVGRSVGEDHRQHPMERRHPGVPVVQLDPSRQRPSAREPGLLLSLMSEHHQHSIKLCQTRTEARASRGRQHFHNHPSGEPCSGRLPALTQGGAALRPPTPPKRCLPQGSVACAWDRWL